MGIIKLEWDSAKDKKHNGKNLIIGQHLPKQQTACASHVEIYGISIDVVDNSNNYRLKRLSCCTQYIDGHIKEISKNEARELLIKEIDNALNVLYDKNEIKMVDQNLNVYREEEEEDYGF
ncbi:hypothetical protein [Tamlana flava]|uniref:hypothetical protein n=1 Tax=Tamlana flava TaxID=3158572 RepID=UPI00351BC203